MPIKSTAGEVLGTLALYGPRPRRPLPEHLTLMQDGARLAGIAIERHRALEKLMHDARHDGLSGLPNRTAIFESLDEALVRIEPDGSVAVLFVDLDGLKTLNDTLGHDRADEMIREVGERLSRAVRSTDFVGRFGGDEFIVVAEEIATEEEASKLGFRLLEAISEPLPGIDGTVLTASIGIALLGGCRADAREAIRRADSAMYEAKRAGGDRIVFFSGTRRTHEGRRLALGRELRGAETRGELSIVFQPVFELETGEIAAVEALLRWDSPTLGQVPPAEFIPVAEDTGSIVPIGAWVLRESCETVQRIARDAGREVELSVNISARQLAQPGFARTVQLILSHAEFPAAQLTLELAEAALIRADAVTARTLHELESQGIRIVLDDFGTGVSSLSWLKEHPVGAIKIDRSFVSGVADDIARPGDRVLADRHVARARLHGHRGGGRDRGAARRPPRARLRARSGVPARPSPAGGGARGAARPPTTSCLIWRVVCQAGNVLISRVWRWCVGVLWSAGWVAVRRAVRDAGQTDIRGFGWPQDHGSSWGAAVYGSSVTSPGGAGCS